MSAKKMMPYLLLLLTVLFWSGNFVLARGIHELFPPLALAFWRWSVALLLLLPFTLRQVWRQRRLLLDCWKYLVVCSLLSVTNFNTFIYLALQSNSVLNTVLINSLTPVFIVGLSWLGYRERLNLVQLTGLGLSLMGLVWMVTRGSPGVLLDLKFAVGDLWTLAAALSWAVYSVLLRRRPSNLHPHSFLTAIVGLGLMPLLPLYLWEHAALGRVPFNPAAVGSVLYIALFPSVLAYLFWNRAVGQIGANKAGIFVHLMPVFSFAMAFAFLGERAEAYHLPGVALIFAGILLTTLPKPAAKTA